MFPDVLCKYLAMNQVTYWQAAAQTYQVQPQVTPTIPIYFQNGQGLPFNVETIVSMVEDMGPELVGFMEPVLLNAVGSQTIDVHILVSVPPSTLNMQMPVILTPISLTPIVRQHNITRKSDQQHQHPRRAHLKGTTPSLSR